MQAESVFVTTTTINTPSRPWLTANYERMVRAGRAYGDSDFRLTDDPNHADFILFVDSIEPYLGDIYRSPLFRRHPDRSYVYNVNDAVVPVLPGMYPDVVGPVRLPDLQLGAFYLRSYDNVALATPQRDVKPSHLFSFVGNLDTAPKVRSRVLALQHPASLLLNRSSGLRDDDLDYVETLRDSHFVLCPRGLGPSSWRFYETMMAARVPIIISDGWVPARDIDWAAFSLRVPESEIESVPELCAAHVDRAHDMGLRARSEWENHCSLARAFGWVGRRLRELREARNEQTLHPKFDLVRDLAFRAQLLPYGLWQISKTFRRGRDI